MPTVYCSYADVITLRIKGILDQALKYEKHFDISKIIGELLEMSICLRLTVEQVSLTYPIIAGSTQ